MTKKIVLLILILGIALVLAAGCTRSAPARQPPSVQTTEMPAAALNVTVPVAPVPVASREGVNLAYELELAPADNKSLNLDLAEVLDPATGRVLFTLDSADLAVLYHPAAVPPPTEAELRDGTSEVPVPRLSIWFVVSPDAVPDRLSHRITMNRSADGQPAVTVTGGDVTVRKDLTPVVIGAPLRGPGWMAMETTTADTHHFRDQISMNGVTRVPQRYAQDWLLLDPLTGKAAPGNASEALTYYGFGKEIYAVADGTVSDASDGLPDAPVIYMPLGTTIPEAAGNYVILDLGNSKYACYAHMVNGSVRVKNGDTVKAGQVIGLVGNSGNSDLPHLHFQVVTDTPSFLGAEGYPHVYRSFNETGSVNITRGMERMAVPGYTLAQLWAEFGDFVSFSGKPVPRANQLPENYAIVSFP